MQTIKDNMSQIGNASSFIGDMLDIFVSNSISLNGDLVKRNRQVTTLENKLGSIHSVDFKAQEDSKELKKELLSLRQEKKDLESQAKDQIDYLQQTLMEKERVAQDLAGARDQVEAKLNRTLAKNKSSKEYNAMKEVSLVYLNSIP